MATAAVIDVYTREIEETNLIRSHYWINNMIKSKGLFFFPKYVWVKTSSWIDDIEVIDTALNWHVFENVTFGLPLFNTNILEIEHYAFRLNFVSGKFVLEPQWHQ